MNINNNNKYMQHNTQINIYIIKIKYNYIRICMTIC